MEPNTSPANSQPSVNNDTILAAVSTIPLVGFILYLALPKVSPFVRHYEKQGTGLFALYVIAYLITYILDYLPLIGGLVNLIIYLALFIGWIVLLINALQNKTYSLPVITDYINQYLK